MHAWRLVSIGIGGFKRTRGTVTHETKSMFSFAFSLDLISSSIRQECVATRLLACSQVSTVLFYARTAKVRVGTNLCRRNTCFSLTSEGSATLSQTKHWSGDCRICRTCSAGPATAYAKLTLQLKTNVKTMQGWGIANLPSILYHPYLVCILIGMPSLHPLTFLVFLKSCVSSMSS